MRLYKGVYKGYNRVLGLGVSSRGTSYCPLRRSERGLGASFARVSQTFGPKALDPRP